MNTYTSASSAFYNLTWSVVVSYKKNKDNFIEAFLFRRNEINEKFSSFTLFQKGLKRMLENCENGCLTKDYIAK